MSNRFDPAKARDDVERYARMWVTAGLDPPDTLRANVRAAFEEPPLAQGIYVPD